MKIFAKANLLLILISMFCTMVFCVGTIYASEKNSKIGIASLSSSLSVPIPDSLNPDAKFVIRIHLYN